MVKSFASFQETLKEFSLLREEPHWFLNFRKRALDLVDKLELPRFQKAKYRHFKLLENPLDTSFEKNIGEVPDFLALKDQVLLYQEDGLTTFLQVPQALSDQGVIFCDLQTALTDYPELMEKYFMTQAVLPEENKLTAFHAAFVENGAFLYVPKNVAIKEPLETYFCQNSTSQAFITHFLMMVEENAQVNYVEHLVSGEKSKEAVSANFIAEVIAKPGAVVNYFALDSFGENVTAYLNRRGHLAKDATVNWGIGLFNEGKIVGDFDTDLAGAGSHSEMKTIAVSSGNSEQIIDNRVTNQAPHTKGHILQHGVALDKGILTFNGIGHIIKGAHGSDAQQESRILMLSNEARADANPILLIDDNDVTAGHAASVGQMEAQDLYYLMSRGLDEEQAQRLVVRGFLGAVVANFPEKSLQEEFISAIEGKLNA